MKFSSQKGYSVVEILVYLAIFTAVSVLVINSYIVMMGSFSATRSNRDILESGSTIMERVSREIRQAKNIDVTNSTLNASAGALQLNTTDANNVARTAKVVLVNGVVNLYSDGVLVGALGGQNINTTSLIFRRIVTTNGEAVKIELTIQNTRGKINQTENFYDTIILRGSY